MMISITMILDLALVAQGGVGMTVLTTITMMEGLMMMIGEVDRYLVAEEDGTIDMTIGPMTTIHMMIDTMTTIGEVYRRLVVEEGGMTIVTTIDLMIGTMTMTGKLPHKAS